MNICPFLETKPFENCAQLTGASPNILHQPLSFNCHLSDLSQFHVHALFCTLTLLNQQMIKTPQI
jgi:hypothetical protein